MDFFKKIASWLDNLMFPDGIKCIFCGRDVPDFDNKPFCEDCEKDLPFNNKNKCLICSEPIKNEATICDLCQKEKRYFKKAFCPFVYDGLVRNKILAYKDSNERYLAKSFAKFIAKELVGLEFDIITFVPMTKKKQRARSFNQAKRLAEEIGKILNVPVKSLFEKVRDSKGQKYLTQNERKAAIEGMYVFNKSKLNRTDRVLIVDDVITTCSTANYCAKLIHKRVSEVCVCAIARNKLTKKSPK